MAHKMENREFADGKRLLTWNELCAYLGMGRNLAREWADKNRVTRKFGKRVLFDKVVIDAVLDAMKADE